MRIVFDKDNTYEEVAGMGTCYRCKQFTKLDPHHRVRRMNDKEGKYVVSLCRKCHEWVHNNVGEAKFMGLLISYYDTGEYKEEYGKS